MPQTSSLLHDIEIIARQAGQAIMDVYRGAQGTAGVKADQKTDGSPLTEADRRAHVIITEALTEGWPDVPVLSEEGRDVPYVVRREWRRLWVVDPLDGTKEFIRGLEEFTVNIALVEEGQPTLGVIYAPAKDLLYCGSAETGATVKEGDGPPRTIRVRLPGPREGLVVVVSRSHPSKELQEFLKHLTVAEMIEAGSSLKLCAVAEGQAHLYPRLGPTSEWDIAAGQAVVEAAGGEVVDLDGRTLEYNKRSLLNPSFLARGIVC